MNSTDRVIPCRLYLMQQPHVGVEAEAEEETFVFDLLVELILKIKIS